MRQKDIEIHKLIQLMEKNYQEYSQILRPIREYQSNKPFPNHFTQLKELLELIANIENEVIDFRLKKILKLENPYLPAIDINKIRQLGLYHNLPLAKIIDHFLKQRSELLKMLKNIPSENWERTGVHEKEGHISFKEFIQRMIKKDQEILIQLTRKARSQEIH